MPPAQGGTQNQALGRSRVGFTTKIHARTNAEGLPIALILSPGEAHDCTAFDAMMAECEANPKVMLAYKGYDTDDIRGELRARGASPEIPTKRNRRRWCVRRSSAWAARRISAGRGAGRSRR